jgi:hypothetical protein
MGGDLINAASASTALNPAETSANLPDFVCGDYTS